MSKKRDRCQHYDALKLLGLSIPIVAGGAAEARAAVSVEVAQDMPSHRQFEIAYSVASAGRPITDYQTRCHGDSAIARGCLSWSSNILGIKIIQAYGAALQLRSLAKIRRERFPLAEVGLATDLRGPLVLVEAMLTFEDFSMVPCGVSLNVRLPLLRLM